TGTDARERGLVDRLGGMEAALAEAARRANVDLDDADIVRYPHASPLARLRAPAHSDAPNASLAAPSLGALDLAGTGSPEALLGRLGVALGLRAGALRLPPGFWTP
ncbi:MAG: signal peptide peptidase SppA, partial [Solirubrobacteraceae bacterium]